MFSYLASWILPSSEQSPSSEQVLDNSECIVSSKIPSIVSSNKDLSNKDNEIKNDVILTMNDNIFIESKQIDNKNNNTIDNKEDNKNDIKINIENNIKSHNFIINEQFKELNTFSHINNTKHIIMLLDESGSMSNNREEIIHSVNKFISEQQTLDTVCIFTLATFDHKYKIIMDNVPIKNAGFIDVSNYQPLGCTSLYDAIGKTIRKYKKERDVVLIIITDGWENTSREFKKKHISDLISEYKSTYAWKFIYLASDPFLLRQGCDLNIINNPETGTRSYAVNFGELQQFVSNVLNPVILNYRKGLIKDNVLNK